MKPENIIKTLLAILFTIIFFTGFFINPILYFLNLDPALESTFRKYYELFLYGIAPFIFFIYIIITSIISTYYFIKDYDSDSNS